MGRGGFRPAADSPNARRYLGLQRPQAGFYPRYPGWYERLESGYLIS